MQQPEVAPVARRDANLATLGGVDLAIVDTAIVESTEGGQLDRKKKKQRLGPEYTYPDGYVPDNWQIFLWFGPWAKEETNGCLQPQCGIFECIHLYI